MIRKATSHYYLSVKMLTAFERAVGRPGVRPLQSEVSLSLGEDQMEGLRKEAGADLDVKGCWVPSMG